MKFGKEFKRQMVPEWMEAYMDYRGLKKILRKVLHHKASRQHSAASSSSHHKFSLRKNFSEVDLHNSIKIEGDIEEQTIEVITEEQNGSRKIYKTDFLREFEEGGEIEVMFFRKLDEELNKVNNFFKDKVKEVMEEVTELNKQMNALVALRIKVQNTGSTSKDANSPNKAVEASRRSNSGREIEESNISVDGGTDDDYENSSSSSEVDEVQHAKCGTTLQWTDGDGDEEDGLKILERVRLNNTLETPLSTLKCVLMDSKHGELCFKKDELRRVERRLKNVLIAFYQKLCLLKHYSYMHLAAFSKIMKKYDKFSTRKVARSYMRVVDDSCIGNPDEVINLIQNVEDTFTKHFANSNRREAMKSLRPKAKREKKGTVTFFSGFFSGCTVALVVGVVLRIQARKLLERPEGASYMENIFPLYSLFGYIVLHMLMYASNVYFWRRYRVNYPFIFGFKQGTELGHREVFLLSNGLLVLALSSFLVNLYLNLGTRRLNYKTVTELVPLGLITVVLVILFCPFNIVYRSSRFFFVRTLSRCICAPFYKVRLPDFFLADHLTSQIQALRCIELYICYYGLGEYSTRQNKCHRHGTYNFFYFIVAAVPFWLRFLQCLRRYYEDRDPMQGYNAFKHFSTIIAVLFRTAFELRSGKKWMVVAFVSSAFATVMTTYWDIVVDWGLLRKKSKNPYLRDKLVVSHKSIYFTAMALNVVLRLSWLQLLLEFNLKSIQKMGAYTIMNCLEIIRRGIWSFFRLENEHLNNVGKYRAFKSVPLPFSYYETNDDKED